MPANDPGLTEEEIMRLLGVSEPTDRSGIHDAAPGPDDATDSLADPARNDQRAESDHITATQPPDQAGDGG